VWTFVFNAKEMGLGKVFFGADAYQTKSSHKVYREEERERERREGEKERVGEGSLLLPAKAKLCPFRPTFWAPPTPTVHKSFQEEQKAFFPTLFSSLGFCI